MNATKTQQTLQEVQDGLSVLSDPLKQDLISSLSSDPTIKFDRSEDLNEQILHSVEVDSVRSLEQHLTSDQRKELSTILGKEEVKEEVKEEGKDQVEDNKAEKKEEKGEKKDTKEESAIIINTSLEKLLEACTDKLLRNLSKTLGLSKEKDRASSIDSMGEELLLRGTKLFLNRLDNSILLRFYTESLLPELSATSSSNTSLLIDKLMVHLFGLEPMVVEEVEDMQSKKEDDNEENSETDKTDLTGYKKTGTKGQPRPPISTIKKGMTKVELNDMFNAVDLREYCKEHGLPTGPRFTKSKLIKNIISYLESGQILKSGKKKRKSSSSSYGTPRKRTKKAKKSEETKSLIDGQRITFVIKSSAVEGEPREVQEACVPDVDHPMSPIENGNQPATPVEAENKEENV